MRYIAIFGIGIFFALLGLALFALTLRKAKVPTTAPKKSELRDLEAMQAETTKLRIAAAVSVVIGAAMMILSS